MTAAAIFATVMTTLVFASIPWLIAQGVTNYNPKLQNKRDRNRYQKRTAVTALLLSALTLPTAGLSWMLATGAAVYLLVHWRRYSRTGRGAKALQEARLWAQIEERTEREERR